MKKYLVFSLLLLTDIAALLLSTAMAFWLRVVLTPFFSFEMAFPLQYFFSHHWMFLIFLFNFFLLKLYVQRLNFWEETHNIVKACGLSFLVIMSVVSLTKISQDTSRSVIFFLFFISLFILPLFRNMVKKILFNFNIWTEDIIVLGAGNAGIAAVTGLKKDKHLGYRVVGFLDDDPKKIGTSIEIQGQRFPVLGKLIDFDYYADIYDLKSAMIAIPSLSAPQLSKLMAQLHTQLRQIFIVPEIKGVALTNTTLYYLFDEQMFLLRVHNNLKSRLNQFIKRTFDFSFCLLLLPFLLVLILVLTILQKLDSPGPVFYVQRRLGKDGLLYDCYKFRTMYVDAEQRLEAVFCNDEDARCNYEKFRKFKGDDPRVSRLGKYLRKSSLDELPQLLNVLKGEMSIVGPRPYMKSELKDLGKNAAVILETRPGITGLWQVSGRNQLLFNDRIQLDAWYVLNWSLWQDIVILLRTVRTVLLMQGAY